MNQWVHSKQFRSVLRGGGAVLALMWMSAAVMAAEPNAPGQPPFPPPVVGPDGTPGQPGFAGPAGNLPGVGVPGIAPPPKPGPNGPFDVAPGDRNGQALVGGAVVRNPEILRKTIQALQEKQEHLAREYQEAMTAMQQSLPRSVQLDLERQELQKRLAETQAQIAELAATRQPMMVAPLPENAVLRAFTLKYVKPEDIGQALHNITGGAGPRIAIDERTNALLIAGTDKQMSVAEQLVNTLDQPGKAQQSKVPETVQVRIVWLLDGLTDTSQFPPKSSIVGPQVVDALTELGFDKPQVVCQQLTTLTLGRPDRSGHFLFQVPVLIEDAAWQFQGDGTISPRRMTVMRWISSWPCSSPTTRRTANSADRYSRRWATTR